MIIIKNIESINSINYIKLVKTTGSNTEILNISMDNVMDISTLSRDSPEFMKYKAFLEFGYYDKATMKPIVIAPESNNLNSVIKFAIGSEYNKYDNVKLLFYGKHLEGNHFAVASPQPTEAEYNNADDTEYYVKTPTYLRLNNDAIFDYNLTYYVFTDGKYKKTLTTQEDLSTHGSDYYIENNTYLRLHEGFQYSDRVSYYIFDNERKVYQELSSDTTEDWTSPDVDKRYWIGDNDQEGHPCVYMYQTYDNSYVLTDLYDLLPSSSSVDPKEFRTQFLTICPWKPLTTYYIRIINDRVELSDKDSFDNYINQNEGEPVYKIISDKFMESYDYYQLSEQFMYAKPNPYDSNETYYIDEDIELLLSIEFEKSVNNLDLNKDKLVTISLARTISNVISISRLLHEDQIINDREHLDQFYSMVPYLDSSDMISNDYMESISGLPNGVVMNNMLITGSFDKYNLGFTYSPNSIRNKDLYIEVIDY